MRGSMRACLVSIFVLGVAPFVAVTAFGSWQTATGDRCTFSTTGSEPRDIVLSPDGTLLYIACANDGDGFVSVILAEDYSEICSIPVGFDPIELAITPDGQYVYATNTVTGYSISKISTASCSVIMDIGGGTDPSGIAITPDGSIVCVVAHWTGSMQLISTATDQVVATIPGLGNGAYDVAITPDGAFAYVSLRYTGPNPGPEQVMKIDLLTNSVVATIPIGGEGLAITPDGSEVWVAGYVTSEYVHVISTAMDVVVDSVFLGRSSDRVEISHSGIFGYVSQILDSSLAVISVPEKRVLASVPVGQGPRGMSISPDGTLIYIANADGDCVSVVEQSDLVNYCFDRLSDVDCDGFVTALDLAKIIDQLFAGAPMVPCSTDPLAH